MDHHPAGHPAGPQTCKSTDDTDGSPGRPLRAVARWLCCPHCGYGPLSADARTLSCPQRHSFDISRQGYVSLLPGRRPHHGDGPTMIAARERFLGRDHYRPLRSTITALIAQHAAAHPELVVDLAGGTGHYLTPVLDALPNAYGAVVDLSTPGLRRAARAHPRAAAVAADLRGVLPIAAGAAAVVLSVFGPRPPSEITRVLTGDGILVVAAASTGHLHELQARLGALGVEPGKRERMLKAFAGFDVIDEQPVDWRLALDRHDVHDLVAMGPSAHHLDPRKLDQAVSHLPTVLAVSAAMTVSVLRRRRG